MLPTFTAGTAIAGSALVIEKRLGKGGMGAVYLARDTLLETHRAVKFIDVEATPNKPREKAVAEVIKEARVIAKLHQECKAHIVEVLSVGVTADSRKIPYIVMEFVNGTTLGTFMKHEGGRLPPTYVQQVGVEVMAALAAAHDHQIVHRDMKPANIMCEPIPGARRANMKVIDWGITSEVNRRTDNIAGTFKFAAPEQVNIRGEHRISGATDIYAVGCILYEALAGQGPFDSTCKTNEQYIIAHLTRPPPPLETLVPNVPSSIARYIESMLAKDPTQRPRSARECAMRLLSLPWDFTAAASADSSKTDRDFSTAVVSALVAQQPQKQQAQLAVPAHIDALEKTPPLAEPPPPQPAPLTNTTASRHVVDVQAQHAPTVNARGHVGASLRGSSTMRSPGSDSPVAPSAAPVVIVHSSPRAPAVNRTLRMSDHPTPPSASVGLAAARAPQRPFYVNDTAPLPPELDTRPKEASTFRAAVRALRHVGESRFSPYLAVVAVTCAIVLAGAWVYRVHRGTALAADSPTAAATSAPLTPPASTASMPSASAAAAVSSLAIASAAISATPPQPTTSSPTTIAAPATNAVATNTSSASPSTAAHAATTATAHPSSKPASAASASGTKGDEDRGLFMQSRKLPGSGL